MASPVVFQLKTVVLLQFWGTLQEPLGARTVMKNSGEVQPVAAAVQATITPGDWGEAGFGVKVTPVQGVLATPRV